MNLAVKIVMKYFVPNGFCRFVSYVIKDEVSRKEFAQLVEQQLITIYTNGFKPNKPRNSTFVIHTLFLKSLTFLYKIHTSFIII